jgi:hypothetical protein
MMQLAIGNVTARMCVSVCELESSLFHLESQYVVPPVEADEYVVFFQTNFVVLGKGSIDTVAIKRVSNLLIIL